MLRHIHNTYYNQLMLTIWTLGVTSGVTLLVSGNSLNFWLASQGVNKEAIGLFSLITLPYAFNFLWAPIIDSYRIPKLYNIFGQRKSWIIALQIPLVSSVLMISYIDPNQDIMLFAINAFIIAMLSSTQDIVLNAFRAELLDEKTQGPASGVYIFGYRVGMLIASSGAIALSVALPWTIIYKFFALIILICILLLFIISATTPSEDYNDHVRLKSVSQFFNNVLAPLGGVKILPLVLLFLILYRLSDNFIGVMINPFLLELGFSAIEIATIGKFFGISSAVIGGIVAGSIMKYIDIKRGLVLFGALHVLAHSLFIPLSIAGDNMLLLCLVIGAESFTGGMSMAAYIAFITSICSGKYKGTQYSFLSSMMGVSRATLPAISGFLVNEFGWTNFYIIITLISIPSIIILYFLPVNLRKN